MSTTEKTPRRNAAAVAARREEAADLKKRFDVWIEQLGGWDKTGTKMDIATMAEYLSKDTDHATSKQSFSAWVTNWLHGSTIGSGALAVFTQINEIFEASTDVQATYIDLIRKASGAIELPEGVDWPFTIELIPVEKLFADDDYQRPIDEVWVRSMLIGFDERLVGSLDVSTRKNGRYAIMDGRQRFTTLAQIGKKTCYCAVYTGMTVGDEANFFFRKNSATKKMHTYYEFRARLLSGDATSKMIDEIVVNAGYTLGASPDVDTISAIRAVESIYDFPTTTSSFGNALAPALATMRKCWYGRASGLDGTLMRGLGRFYSLYGAEELQMRHFEEQLTALGPVLVLGRARDDKDNNVRLIASRIDVAVATTLAEVHNAGLPRAARISLDRIPRPMRQRARRTPR